MSDPPQPPQPAAPLEQRWYLPTWSERLGLMRWRLVYFVPALLLLVLSAFIPILLLWLWKLLVLAIALPAGAFFNAARHALRLRTEPFCIHCGYNLTTLPEHHPCPECGIPFTFHEIDDYRRDPHWFIRRRKMLAELPPPDPAFHAGPAKSPRRRDGT